MPLLSREPEIYPEQLLEQADLGCESDRSWWALYTLARHEKELLRRLRVLGISFYMPLITQRSRSASGRIRVAHVPLFSGYVFMYGDGSARHRAMTTRCISRWLAVANGTELTHDLRQIHHLIAAGAPLTPEARLEPGMRVRIRSGPLEGLEGVVIKRNDQARLLLAVNFLQQGASVLLEDYQIERLD